jgi:hypothetical protein
VCLVVVPRNHPQIPFRRPPHDALAALFDHQSLKRIERPAGRIAFTVMNTSLLFPPICERMN